MAEDTGLYWGLFQGQFPDEWKRDPGFMDYLSHLSGYTLEKLQLEPGHLKEETRLVLNSTQKLAFNNYQTFIQTADCTREVFKDFVAVEEHVGQLMERLPQFSQSCQNFSSQAQDIMNKRKQNSLALSKHSQLLEVLEIPQVMETCVRNGYYEEALELSSHVERLAKKHNTTSIILSIQTDTQHSLELMLTQLLAQLRGSIQLPACLRVVGYLKRMSVYSDKELRLKFLQARDSWLEGVLAAIPSDDPYQHISKTIEASRVHLFDIVTQYRAIFPDDEGSRQTVGNTLPGALFYTWLNSKVWEFLQLLECDLARGVGSRLDSLLGQAMYFGLSFSRIGADFRTLVVPVFVRAVLASFRHTLRTAKHQFHTALKNAPLPSSLRGDFSTVVSQAPPHSLLDHTPLAVLTNQIIAGFNEMRGCAPLCVGPEVCRELTRLLESVVHDLVELHRTGSFSESEADGFRHLVGVVISDFLPYVHTLFTNMFKSEAVELVAMTTPFALANTKEQSSLASTKLEQLDISSIAEPLNCFVRE